MQPCPCQLALSAGGLRRHMVLPIASAHQSNTGMQHTLHAENITTGGDLQKQAAAALQTWSQ